MAHWCRLRSLQAPRAPRPGWPSAGATVQQGQSPDTTWLEAAAGSACHMAMLLRSPRKVARPMMANPCSHGCTFGTAMLSSHRDYRRLRSMQDAFWHEFWRVAQVALCWSLCWCCLTAALGLMLRAHGAALARYIPLISPSCYSLEKYSIENFSISQERTRRRTDSMFGTACKRLFCQSQVLGLSLQQLAALASCRNKKLS